MRDVAISLRSRTVLRRRDCFGAPKTSHLAMTVRWPTACGGFCPVAHRLGLVAHP